MGALKYMKLKRDNLIHSGFCQSHENLNVILFHKTENR